MVEGETEMLLLPSMLREALGLESLGFQIVPGLSKANKSQLPVNASGTAHIHYLVDGDIGGTSLKNEILKNGIAEQDIFMLALSGGGKCQIEDFLSTPLLIEAVNQIIGKFSPGCCLIEATSLPATGKFSELEKRFELLTSKCLQKVDVAYELLTIRGANLDVRILDATKVKPFEELAKLLQSKFYPDFLEKA